MNKYKNIYCTTSIILFIIFINIYIYVGNCIYNITIDRHSDHYFIDLIQISETKKQNSDDWYNHQSRLLHVSTKDELILKGSYINQKSDTCIIMVHGYRNDKTYLLPQVKRFYNLGYDLMVIDLRGHGLSQGESIGTMELRQ